MSQLRGLVVGAPNSGAGKTTVTLALLAALRRRGIAVRAAKAGPDYIDPAFHSAATGAPAFNLDSWAMTAGQRAALVGEAAQTGGLFVVESAMGLFDGVAGEPGRAGSGADLAAQFRLPVVLVLDVTGQSQTAAAVARGFIGHQADVEVAGVVLNRVGSAKHLTGVRDALARSEIPLLGALPRDPTLAMPERHLGLVQAEEHPALGGLLAGLADLAEANLDLDRIVALAKRPRLTATGQAGPMLRPPGQRIALARDAAFSFIYPHHLQQWRAAGCEIHPFSPLADEPPPDGCDVCWLPGGYPELHAGRLAAARRFKAGLERFAATRPVHGECGGYMVLGRTLQDSAGEIHEMTGLLSHATSFARRKLNLGYRRAEFLGRSPFGVAVMRGHEFHYATLSDPGVDQPLVRLQDARGGDLGLAGGWRGAVSGGFFHAIAADG